MDCLFFEYEYRQWRTVSAVIVFIYDYRIFFWGKCLQIREDARLLFEARIFAAVDTQAHDTAGLQDRKSLLVSVLVERL